MPYNDVVGYQLFKGPCCFHLQGEVTGASGGHRYRTRSVRQGKVPSTFLYTGLFSGLSYYYASFLESP
jgi:hypothetical protein